VGQANTNTNKQNIENRRDNQEWAAVNIGYNTQNEDKQNSYSDIKATL
jgi:hypothetical protein